MAKKRIFSVTIKDCEVQTFASGGPGGQHQNKTASGVRIIHHPSGARGECRETRSQAENKKRAFRRMAESQKFQLWVQRVSHQLPDPEKVVEKDMHPSNLKIEARQNGKWVPFE